MPRKNAKGSSKQDSGADDTGSNNNNGNAAAANELDSNAPPASLHGLDLSRYRQPALVEALDRLTSFTYAGSLLLKPALKIMWRSALYQDGEVRMKELMSQLIGNTPINEPPTPAAADAAVAAASSDKKKPAAASSAPRSLQERFFHFFFVGIPMAVLVGLATGVVNFVSCIWRDVMTVASTSHLLLSQAKTDLSYYMQHPESRPTKDEAINAWSQQIVQPYAQTIVKRKLGPFGVGFLSGPISRAVQALIRRAAATSATEVQHYAKKYKGFDVFKPEGATDSSSAAGRELR